MTNKDLQKLFETKYKSKIASTRGRLDKDGNPIEVRLTLEEFTMLYKDAGVLPIAPYVISRKKIKDIMKLVMYSSAQMYKTH